MKRIQVKGDSFWRGQQPFRLIGFNYWPSSSPGSAPGGSGDWSAIQNYDSAVVEQEIAAMAEIGANTLRVWFGYSEAHWSAANNFTREGRRCLVHLLDMCEKNGLYVIPTLGGAGTRWGVNHGLGNTFQECPSRIYTDQAVEDQFLADILTLMDESDMGVRENVLAIDLANEPVFGIPNAKLEKVDATWAFGSGDLDFEGSLRIPSAVSAWEHWACNAWGSKAAAAAAWELKYKPEEFPIPRAEDFLFPGHREKLAASYQLFVNDCLNQHGMRMGEAIRSRYPHMLVTIGLGCGGTGACFQGGSLKEARQVLMLTQNVGEMQDGLDFVCIHLYDSHGTDLSRISFLRRFLGSSRPVVIEEFAHIPRHIDPQTRTGTLAEQEAQAAFWDLVLSGTVRYNFAGALGCIYVDMNDDPFKNGWACLGITTRSGKSKPAHSIFKKWASSKDAPVDFHPVPIPYDPGAYRNSVQMIGELYARNTNEDSPKT